MTYSPAIHHRHSIRLHEYDYARAGVYFITICTQQRKHIFGEIVGAGFTPALPTESTPALPTEFTPALPTESTPALPTEFTPALPTGFTPALDGEIPNTRVGSTPTQMKLNEYGQIACNQWQKIPERFANIELDVFVVMPNHIHGIIVIHDPVGAGFTPALVDVVPNAEVGAFNTTNGLPLRVTVGYIVGAYKSLVANECLKIYKSKNEFMGKLWQRNYYEHIIRDEKSFDTIQDYILNNPDRWESDQLYPEGNV